MWPGVAHLMGMGSMEIMNGDGPRALEVGKYSACLPEKRKRMTLELNQVV